MKEIKFKVQSTGELVDVSFVSYKEMEDLFGKGSAKPLLSACGFLSTYITSEQIDVMREHFSGNETALAAMANTAPGNSIHILSDIDELISEENGEAIFLHEVGHVVHAHSKSVMEGTIERNVVSVNGCGLIMDEIIEIEADAYAASFVGYHRMLAAIRAIVEAQAEVAAKLSNGKIVAEELFAEVMAEVKSTARWAELLKYTEGY